MRKPVLARILRLMVLYLVVFTVLVMFQFAKRGSFSVKAGQFTVSGQLRLPGEGDPPTVSNEYLLATDTHVSFGGLDFNLAGGDGAQSLYLIMENGRRAETLPDRLFILGDSLRFIFPGGSELIFTTEYSGDELEMQITGVFPEGVSGIALPFSPLRRTGIRDTGDGQFIVNSEGVNYTFGRSPMVSNSRVLQISVSGLPVSYRTITERRALLPGNYILPPARSAESHNELITRWRDQNYALWNRNIANETNEDVIIAYAGESFLRGTYRTSIASVSARFLNGTTRTYESSVYLGNLDQAYRSLTTREREKQARLTRLINDKSLEFLKEHRVVDYFAARGLLSLLDAGAEIIRATDPASLALDITPGILEGYLDWRTFRPHIENPFERLVDQACFVITESLRIITIDETGFYLVEDRSQVTGEDLVFSFFGSQGDMEFNLRLGKALLSYAEHAINQSHNNTRNDEFRTWASIGRSLVYSVLSMSEVSGTVKAELVISEDGEITENMALQDLSTARLYRILNPVEPAPRAIAIGAAVNGIYAWTAAESVSASQDNNVIDIAVGFRDGETHYMIIRGIRPFVKIQLYNMDFRTDPQFERYDSSGWSYVAQEQTLIVKMRHRAHVEHIRIFY